MPNPMRYVIPPVLLATFCVLAIPSLALAEEPAQGYISMRGVPPSVAAGTRDKVNATPDQGKFPFIDPFGQYMHSDWPGKIHEEKDLAERLKIERAELAAHPRPADWDRYGGWRAGPQLKATGFFRAEKIEGRWWLVDPEGRLFWSHGVVRVGTRIRVGTVYHGTPILDREHYFQLPPKDGPLSRFYGTEPQSTKDYYIGKEGHAVYDHLEANLFRKYGEAWPEQYSRMAQDRLASWGLNSIANSSDPQIYLRRQTPYTAIIYSAPLGRSEHRIEGSSGGWGKLPDPFDPGFSEIIQQTLRTELKDVLGDPWCLGFFVDNELHWGDACYLAEATLASPAHQPAKRVFIEALKEKYGPIEKLNAAWGVRHTGWETLLGSTVKPNHENPAVKADLESFSEKVMAAYFRTCRESVKAASPNHMYLGCRFAGSNPLVLRQAAKYCDVISINSYKPTVSGLRLPAGLDRPIVIGEFHFGALDRGLLHPGLVPVKNQVERAQAYKKYVHSALKNPAVVGTHWFQFYDQPTTGRFDGENFQIGLLDICDTPYRETTAAVREIGATMYAIRSGTSPD